jgi:hypothetical protein
VAYLITKVAIWTIAHLLRHVPVVGGNLSDSYDDRVFSPVADDVEVAAAEREVADGHEGTLVRLVVRNRSWVDIEVSGLDVRIGRSERGGTLRNVAWVPAFEKPPTNVDPTRVPAGGEGAVTIEFFEPAVDPDDELWVDGSLVFEYSFLVRERRFSFGDRSFDLAGMTAER